MLKKRIHAKAYDHFGHRADGASVQNFSDAPGKPTISDNRTSGSDGGGAISNSGTLTVTQSTITDNIANGPGGITNMGGTVTITNSTIAHNGGAHEAGGLANYAGTIVITATTFANNGADGGGAILNTGTLTVTDSAFTDNVAGLLGTRRYRQHGDAGGHQYDLRQE
jgi:hypothetical protein